MLLRYLFPCRPIPYLLILIACGLLNGLLVYALRPDTAFSGHVELISGPYSWRAGGAEMGDTSKVGGRSIKCFVNYLGPIEACGRQHSGQLVTAKLVTYRNLFGWDSVAIEIESAMGTRTSTAPQELKRRWWRSSISDALVITLVLSQVLGLIYGYFSKRKEKNGD